jgi:hypothetical protein
VASGEPGGDSVVVARSDMGLSVWQGNRAGSSRIGAISYGDCRPELKPPGCSNYRSNDTVQYASAATMAAAGMVMIQA